MIVIRTNYNKNSYCNLPSGTHGMYSGICKTFRKGDIEVRVGFDQQNRRWYSPNDYHLYWVPACKLGKLFYL